MFKVVLKFENNKIKEIESVELSTLEEAQKLAIKGKDFYDAIDYDIVEVKLESDENLVGDNGFLDL